METFDRVQLLSTSDYEDRVVTALEVYGDAVFIATDNGRLLRFRVKMQASALAHLSFTSVLDGECAVGKEKKSVTKILLFPFVGVICQCKDGYLVALDWETLHISTILPAMKNIGICTAQMGSMKPGIAIYCKRKLQF